VLDVQLPEYVQGLLKANDLQCMAAGNINRRVAQSCCQEASTHLIETVDESPVDDFQNEREAEQKSALKSILEMDRVRRVEMSFESQ
jgi:hypothetical protein